MDRQSIIEKFAALNIGSDKERRRARHKPLLVLYAIGRLLRNEDRLIPYPEVDARLENCCASSGCQAPIALITPIGGCGTTASGRSWTPPG